MKITIEYDLKTSQFTAQFDRNPAERNGTWPPPPPENEEVEAMAKWLASSYQAVLKKFADQEISGLTLTFKA
jgi:hypothetical protein